MRFLKYIIIIIIVSFMIGILITFNSAEIIDLIHKDTESVHVGEGYQFSDPGLNKYQIDGILFKPYIRINPFDNYTDKFDKYSLKLASYKQKDNKKIIINNVIVEAITNVNVNKIVKPLNKELQYNDSGVQSSEVTLIDQINDYNMVLNNKSQIRIVLNISIQENGEIITRDLEYTFVTKIRKYIIQR